MSHLLLVDYIRQQLFHSSRAEQFQDAVFQVVILHSPYDGFRGKACRECTYDEEMPYPCPTIRTIERELKWDH